MSDPFTRLGLDADASATEVRAARRQLAKQHHPDAGGDAAEMRELNDAAASALRLIEGVAAASDPSDVGEDATRPAPGASDASWQGGSSDTPSFTVEALPAETYEALLVATASLGEVIDDDPPYRLEVLLNAPFTCWCRLDLVPDAGSSTVSMTVASVDAQPRPTVEHVRDLWIEQLNQLEW